MVLIGQINRRIDSWSENNMRITSSKKTNDFTMISQQATQLSNNNKKQTKLFLPGGFNPFAKILLSQNGSFPQEGFKIEKYLKPPPSFPFRHEWILFWDHVPADQWEKESRSSQSLICCLVGSQAPSEPTKPTYLVIWATRNSHWFIGILIIMAYLYSRNMSV